MAARDVDQTGCPQPPASLAEFLSLLDVTGGFDDTSLTSWLRRVRPGLPEVWPYLRFDDASYTRNRIVLTDAYEALLMCWKPGQRSPIHDHHGSLCGVRVLAGVATETRFARVGTRLREAGRERFAGGSVTVSSDDDIHVVANEGDCNLLTLHVYSPPLQGTQTYPASLVEWPSDARCA